MNAHQHKEFDIPLTEDLMREHGILNRVLLIYEKIITDVTEHKILHVHALQKAVAIIQIFIEGHHERLEEDYIFPLFIKHHTKIDLIKTLQEQHIKGREITAQVQSYLSQENISHTEQCSIQYLLQEFIRMYRPHEAHEDTDIFPQVRSFLTEEEFEELGQLFETFEHQTLGKGGVENIIETLRHIEQELTISNLNQFTPTNI